MNAEHLIMLLMALGVANAHAKLPQPSPEEQAAAAQKKAAQQAHATDCEESQSDRSAREKTPVLPGCASQCDSAVHSFCGR